jgi:hypothetical protein
VIKELTWECWESNLITLTTELKNALEGQNFQDQERKETLLKILRHTYLSVALDEVEIYEEDVQQKGEISPHEFYKESSEFTNSIKDKALKYITKIVDFSSIAIEDFKKNLVDFFQNI